MPVFLDWIDQKLINFIIQIDFLPFFKMKILTFMGNIKIHLFILLILFLKSELMDKEKNFLWTKLFFQLSILFSILYILKITFIRVRPEFSIHLLEVESLWQRFFDNRFHSFPSSHVATMGFWLAYKPKSLPVILITMLMSVSRISLNQHYPSDVLFGLLLGPIVFFVTNKFYYYLDKKKASA